MAIQKIDPLVQQLLDSVNQPRSEQELLQRAGDLYNPYFSQQGQEVQGDFNLANTRLGEDQGFASQDYERQLAQLQLQQGMAREQDVGNLNDRFGDTYGSPLQQSILGQQDQLRGYSMQGLQQNRTQQQTGFARQQYDAGEILRKNKQKIEQQRQEAVANYTTNPYNQYSGIFSYA